MADNLTTLTGCVFDESALPGTWRTHNDDDPILRLRHSRQIVGKWKARASGRLLLEANLKRRTHEPKEFYMSCGFLQALAMHNPRGVA
ncbi:hypothetical protein PILCRDRAFT_828666 [Piloderma croceum F 1598]|uniref:Uncharacterized protein n=1 Tax=Piloderma croceum (strain F 1598) TaxID=765440 RepID=A0A0C3F184_PILCF|nr:hypothetical protein PILCRDRAFT_828666 [Piloderma croceum F 1598]